MPSRISNTQLHTAWYTTGTTGTGESSEMFDLHCLALALLRQQNTNRKSVFVPEWHLPGGPIAPTNHNNILHISSNILHISRRPQLPHDARADLFKHLQYSLNKYKKLPKQWPIALTWVPMSTLAWIDEWFVAAATRDLHGKRQYHCPVQVGYMHNCQDCQSSLADCSMAA